MSTKGISCCVIRRNFRVEPLDCAMIPAVIRMLLRRVCLCNLVCVYVLFRLISIARYEICREDVASDPEEEKRIKKAQERAVEKKNKMVSKELRKARIRSSSAASASSGDDRMLFRGMLTVLSLIFSMAGKCSHSVYLTVCIFLL